MIMFVALVNAGAALGGSLHLIQAIPLPNVEGRIDHMAVDLAGQRLFVAALGNNSVEVIDLKAGKWERSLAGFHEPQGLAWIPERNSLFVASGEDDVCHVVDGRSFSVAAVAGKTEDADNVRYAGGRVYVGCGRGELRVIDPQDWSTAGKAVLPAHPEGFQVGSRVFANVPEQRSIVVMREGKVVATWPVPNAAGNFPLALDESHGRLYVGCRKPPVLLVLDSETGKEIATVVIDGDTDDVFYDAKAGKLYVSCGTGFIDVLDEQDLLPFMLAEKIPTAEGARTSLLVPELNRLYLAVPHRGKQQAEIRVYETAGD